MDVVQIDHTLVDVMVVDREYRQSIGRPWLTLAIDVAIRLNSNKRTKWAIGTLANVLPALGL